ncbi:hypothetical protein D1J51_05935 [Leucobacter sp. wl10]|nr:hypothetical protein D1J51_05935 [Leucobacter sp. wl10]
MNRAWTCGICHRAGQVAKSRSVQESPRAVFEDLVSALVEVRTDGTALQGMKGWVEAGRGASAGSG